MFAREMPVALLVLAIAGCSPPAGDELASVPGTGHAASCAAEGEHEGQATYYDFADGSGACSFDPTPDDSMVAAMNAPDYAGSAACGSGAPWLVMATRVSPRTTAPSTSCSSAWRPTSLGRSRMRTG